MPSANKTIFFDVNPLVIGNKSGVGYYSEGLLLALADQYPDLHIHAHYFNFMGKKRPQLPSRQNITYHESKILPGKFLSITRRAGFQLPVEIFFRKNYDVAIFPNFVSLPTLRKKPIAIVIHDLAYIDLPQVVHQQNRQFLKRFVKKSIVTADVILCVSRFTKSRVLENYKIDESKIVVTHIPPAPTLDIRDAESLKKFELTRKSFVLFVGTLEPRKNIRFLVDSYINLDQQLKTKHPLVLAGGEGWYMEKDMLWIKKKIKEGENVRLLGYITEDERAILYKNAAISVMPSVYEGFGMPILEAMSYGTPTLVSDIEVFHEVAENASAFASIKNVEKFSFELSRLLNDEKLRTDYSKKGLERITRFNWADVAQEVYTKLFTEIRDE